MDKPTTHFQKLSKSLQERIRKFNAENPIDDGGFIRREVARDFVERYLHVQLTEIQAEQLEALSFEDQGPDLESSAALLEKILSPHPGFKAIPRATK